MSLIPVSKKDNALWSEIEASKTQPGLHIWWLGQSGFLVQLGGFRLLFDPYLSDSLTLKYAGTDKPHVRMSERALDANLIRGLHLVTSTHNHTDHLDQETLAPILHNNPKVKLIVPEANREFVAARIPCSRYFPIGMTDGLSRKFTFDLNGKPLECAIQGIPAKHNEIDRDAHGQCLYMGYVIQFGGYTVYHSGDTLWFDELVEILAPFQVDIAFLPINGNKPERRVAGNLDCREAAALGKAIGARCVIPCHYDMFEFNTANVADFVNEANAIAQPFRVLKGGERLRIG